MEPKHILYFLLTILATRITYELYIRYQNLKISKGFLMKASAIKKEIDN